MTDNMKKSAVIFLVLSSFIFLHSCNKNTGRVKETLTEPEKTMCGGYTDYRPMTEDDLAVFEQYSQDNKTLTPVEVATQVVAGINYRFHCVDESRHDTVITIFVPLPCNRNGK